MRVFFQAIVFFFLFLEISCNSKIKTSSHLFTDGKSLGEVSNRLEEASGLVESIANPMHLWTLNDSGNPAEVFLIDQKAQIKLVCKLNDINNRDFEDIAIGAGPINGKNYVYVADIGDNLQQYKTKLIYRFEEPTLADKNEVIITNYDTLRIALPDGIRDSETIMIDPQSNDLYLVSKREDSVRVYKIRYPFSKDLMTADKVAVIPFTKIVAGSITPDGKEVLIKDYEKIYYWKNNQGLPLPQLLITKPIEVAYEQEPQGEAICWSRDGSGYYTLSETAESILGKLIFHKRK